MLPVKSVKVIINARSGLGDKADARRRLTQIFEVAGIESEIVLAESGAEVVAQAKVSAGENWTVVMAGGGDGTINTVASYLVGTDKILGVLALGTLNHFAKDLRIPLDLEAAAQTVISGRAAPVDVAEVNGRIFLNNSSLGLYPPLVCERRVIPCCPVSRLPWMGRRAAASI
jgi:diacylglycerol kinase family enzyme